MKNGLSCSDAANIANEESGMNINSTKNTINNIEQMLQGKTYKYQCGYEHTKFNVERLIKDYPDKKDNIIRSLKLYQEKKFVLI